MMKITKRISAVFLAASLCVTALAITSCGSSSDDDSSQHVSSPQKITISIDYPNSSKYDDIVDESIRVETKSTAYDAIQLYCYVEDVDLYGNLTKGRITGIGDIMNGYKGSKNSWQLYINDELYDGNESDYRLKKDDSLKWKFNVVKKSSSKKSN